MTPEHESCTVENDDGNISATLDRSRCLYDDAKKTASDAKFRDRLLILLEKEKQFDAVDHNREEWKARALQAETIATDAKFEIDRLVDVIRRLRHACFQAWWGFRVLRGQRPEDDGWTEPQRKAMRELDRLIEVTKAAKDQS